MPEFGGLIPDPLFSLLVRFEKLETRLAELEKGTASPEPKQWRPMKTITVEIPAKNTPDFESECCRKSYWEGFQKGVYVAKMENKSGCCCVFNSEESEVLQWCALHASLRGSK